MAKPRFLAVVPMKPLAESKTRLHPHLTSCRRAGLSLSMLNWVLGVLKSFTNVETMVVGGDCRVGDAARRAGACWVDDIRLDLNEAVEYGFSRARKASLPAFFIPADLPLLSPEDVEEALRMSEGGAMLTICPAHDGGTNGLIIPPDMVFAPRLGHESFKRHVEEASELGVGIRLFSSPGFESDLDTMDDLRRCVEMGAPGIAEYIELSREGTQ